jgi:hypothetical protein
VRAQLKGNKNEHVAGESAAGVTKMSVNYNRSQKCQEGYPMKIDNMWNVKAQQPGESHKHKPRARLQVSAVAKGMEWMRAQSSNF